MDPTDLSLTYAPVQYGIDSPGTGSTAVTPSSVSPLCVSPSSTSPRGYRSGNSMDMKRMARQLSRKGSSVEQMEHGLTISGKWFVS